MLSRVLSRVELRLIGLTTSIFSDLACSDPLFVLPDPAMWRQWSSSIMMIH